MKICHLTSLHPYNDIRIFHKECRVLCDAGHEVHLVAPNAPNTVIHGIKLHGLNGNNQSRILRPTKTIWSVYRQALALNADVYHFHDPELLIIGLLLKAKNKKVIYDAHEDFPRTILTKHWIPKAGRNFISRLSEKIENMISKRLQLIVAATPHIADRFRTLGCHVVNINNYPMKKELVNPPVNWQTKQPSICYCGSINDKRGIFEIIAALEYTDFTLLLAGQFESRSQRNRAMRMPGWKNVKELGQIDRNGIKQVLQESMAGLSILSPTPSYIHSLPIKMFEYMASGIPVIASDFPLWKEIIYTNKCGVCVNPFDPKEIASAINFIIANQEEARVMGENGRIAVIEQFNWETESNKLIQFYHDNFY
jgi:glycosyltransferase involved in cell wall biosynthesis